MSPGTLAAALGRAFGRFEESWGNRFDHEDPHDVEALAHLLHQELDTGLDKEALRKVMAMVEKWGEAP